MRITIPRLVGSHRLGESPHFLPVHEQLEVESTVRRQRFLRVAYKFLPLSYSLGVFHDATALEGGFKSTRVRRAT